MLKRQFALTVGISVVLFLTAFFPAQARDFTYDYEDQTVTYTVIDEETKTCMTRPGIQTPNGSSVTAGNTIVSGRLILPEHPKDGDVEFTLVEIGDYSFSFRSQITSLSLPNTVKSIGARAFDGCTGLTSIGLNEGLLNVGEYAFHYCTNLLEVNIPNTTTFIGKGAFDACHGIETIHIGNSITTISRSTFASCSKLKSIFIPSSVTTIEEGAFAACTSLEKAEFCSIEDLCKIDFEGETGSSNPLTLAHHLYINGREVFDIVIPEDITTVKKSTFREASYINSVVLTESTKTIEEFAFAGCENLQYIYLFFVTSIGEGAFSGCTNLPSIALSEDLTVIQYSAFGHCRSLSSITIPNSVTSIAPYAFGWCSALKTIILGNSVESIRDGAFSGCKDIEIVYSLNTVPPEINSFYFVFDTIEKNTTVYVPGESKGDYVSATGWSTFNDIRAIGNIHVALETYSLTLTGDESIKIEPLITEEEGAIITSVEWSSSNEEVATVENGLVKGLSSGTATITLTVTDILNRNYQASCEVIVNDFTTKIESLTDNRYDSLKIYDTTGTYLGNSMQNLPSGIYILKKGSSTQKVFIK